MSDIRQWLVTLSDDGMTIKDVQLTVPSGMRVQLCEHDFNDECHTCLKLPVLFDGGSVVEMGSREEVFIRMLHLLIEGR